jgi:2-polyprenyl-3-methyl-5-hydroxy-6-metoxy-1,4-benzoquinol methylase
VTPLKQHTSVPIRCMITGASDVDVFFGEYAVPVMCNVLWPSQQTAREAPSGEIHLGFSPSSGHIFNTAFKPDLLEYDQRYENSLHFSPRFQRYVESLAAGLIERYQLRGKTIIDVGCGKGDFLKLICRMADARGVGFDRSYEPTPEDAANPQVTFIQSFFDEVHDDHYQADFICCRHVLEHVSNPVDFLRDIRRALQQRRGAVVFFEVPNALYTLRDMGIWDIIYEHVSYFTPNSLVQAFTAAGFDVLRLSETYGGQFLTIEARATAEIPGQAGGNLPGDDELARLVRDFASAYWRKFNMWHARLEQLAAAGKRVVVWGSGSKGVTFLNVLNTQNQIAYVVDINPHNQGKFVAGSGQQVVAPDFLREYQPQVVIITNPLYREEIAVSLAELGIGAEILVA